MKLFLASEAKNPQSIKKLEKYVKGFKGKDIAYIPTAANGEGWGSWKDGGSWKLVQTLEAHISLIQLEDYFNQDMVPLLNGKDIIWFSGGQPGYLMYWIRRLKLDKHLKKLLKDGCIYVGSSAGSMVTARNLKICDWYPEENEPGASIIPGLGLVDFDIFPHFQEHLFSQIKSQYQGKKLYLLKDGEEIIVDDGNVFVVGEKRIIKNS